MGRQENRFAAVMRRDPKHAQEGSGLGCELKVSVSAWDRMVEWAWQELDDKLQENVVQKNHLLQVLNKAGCRNLKLA